jgi:sugar/nucleoside kinase (ribokinase family)
MVTLNNYNEIDYLLIGHITKDVTPSGPLLGGSVSYASLTARQLGMRVGIVSSWGPDINLDPLEEIPLAGFPDDRTTTYQNIETPAGRIQYVHNVAADLNYHHIPDIWRTAAITHLAPLNQEVQPSLIPLLQSESLYVTPQGWMRSWDEEGKVSATDWPESAFVLGNSNAAVVSREDLIRPDEQLEEMASASQLLVATDGKNGTTVFFRGESRRFYPPLVEVVDTTGAGDIFATVFFVHYFRTQDPWEAALIATALASYSTQRVGFRSIPTPEEVEASMARTTQY